MYVSFKDYNCIGLLGGTFNPVHLGHLMMAEAAYNQVDDIEKIVFMPNNKTAYKDNEEIENQRHRLNMLQLATEEYDFAGISDIEVNRGGVTYTVDTLREIIHINPDIKVYFIIGADSLYTFTKWRDFEEVLRMCTLLVVNRESSYVKLKETGDYLACTYGADIRLLNTEEFDASSTEIRQKIKNGICVSDKLPEKVLQYIRDNGLYKQ